MSEVFETASKVWTATINGEAKTFDAPIELEDVKTVCKSEGVRKFTITDEAGSQLGAGDFPYDGNIIVEEYNEAK